MLNVIIYIDWAVYIYCCIHIHVKHVATDVLVRSSMKSATSCVMQRELYDSVIREKHEHKLCSRVAPIVCVFQCRLHSAEQCCCSQVIYLPMCGWPLPLQAGSCCVCSNRTYVCTHVVAWFTYTVYSFRDDGKYCDVVWRCCDRAENVCTWILLAYPLNLSISISGGEPTTMNTASHCEWMRATSQFKLVICSLKCCIECIVNVWAGLFDLQYRASKGDSPVHDLPAIVYGMHYLNSIPPDWNVNWCYISPKFWHMSETDRTYVPWGSCEKNFENIVIWTWIRYSVTDVVCALRDCYMCIFVFRDELKCYTWIRCCTLWCILQRL